MNLLAPDAPELRLPSLEVVDFDLDLVGVITTMYCLLDGTERAVGLAAPQMGVMRRVVVYDLGDGEERGVMVNPTVFSRSKKSRTVTEGCLSFPGMYWQVRRALSVTTTYQDRWGREHIKVWHGLGAQMVQHELDHLDGILLPDIAICQVR